MYVCVCVCLLIRYVWAGVCIEVYSMLIEQNVSPS